jgi:hypothetical protein
VLQKSDVPEGLNIRGKGRPYVEVPAVIHTLTTQVLKAGWDRPVDVAGNEVSKAFESMSRLHKHLDVVAEDQFWQGRFDPQHSPVTVYADPRFGSVEELLGAGQPSIELFFEEVTSVHFPSISVRVPR